MTLPPLPDLREALLALLKYAEINECQHDETHRGGVIWTICDGCGRNWADDRNPFKGYQEPAAITNARAALAAVPAQPVAWMDDFGNVFPLAANKGAGSWMDDHKRNWKPLYAAPQAVPVPAGWSVTYDGKRASYIYADQETAEFEAQQVGGTARAVAVYLAAAPKEQPHE